jgi:hypothetical protein
MTQTGAAAIVHRAPHAAARDLTLPLFEIAAVVTMGGGEVSATVDSHRRWCTRCGESFAGGGNLPP